MNTFIYFLILLKCIKNVFGIKTNRLTKIGVGYFSYFILPLIYEARVYYIF